MGLDFGSIRLERVGNVLKMQNVSYFGEYEVYVIKNTQIQMLS